MKVDIIGAGISGLSTAISIKQHNKNIDVIVHEKNKKIGYNREGRKCGEGHTVEREWSKWIPEEKSYFNSILKGELLVGNKKIIYYKKPGQAYILNRPEFICQLARKAKKLGVIIKTDDKVKSIKDLDGKYIVDASGCPSFVKKELEIKQGLVGIGYQQTLEKSNSFYTDKIKVFYTGELGYFWIFPRNPKKKEINVGIGVYNDSKVNLKKVLEEFKIREHITGKINYSISGLIPAGLQRPLKHNNILFVGDTGVGTLPINGQGIYRALISGDIAGKCIAHNQVEKYPKIINQEFIKWDIIGKSFAKINIVLKHIGPKAVLFFVKKFIAYGKIMFH